MSEIQNACEAVIIELLGLDDGLRALNPSHDDTDDDATKCKIVVKAVGDAPEAPSQLVASKDVRRVQMEVEVRGSINRQTAEDTQSTFEKVRMSLSNLTEANCASLPSISKFIYLQLTTAVETNREKNEHRRRRTLTFSMLGILKT